MPLSWTNRGEAKDYTDTRILLSSHSLSLNTICGSIIESAIAVAAEGHLLIMVISKQQLHQKNSKASTHHM